MAHYDKTNTTSNLHKGEGTRRAARSRLRSAKPRHPASRKCAKASKRDGSRRRFSGVFDAAIAVTARRRQQTKPICDQCKFRKRSNFKLLHHIVPMQFDRPLRGTQRMGDLLVYLAANQQRQDLALARGQPGKAHT